jgi:hypothetical protein
LSRLGGWNGADVSYNIKPMSGGLKTAVLVQGTKGGAILAAATD